MLKKLYKSETVKNTLWMFFGQGIRIAIQAAYFVIIARTLGVEGFGIFVGIVSLVALLSPFSSWGAGNLLIMHTARDREAFPEYWGKALIMTFLSGSVLTVATYLGTSILMPVFSATMVIAIGISDFIFMRVLEVSAQAFQAFHNLKRTALLHMILSLTRLIGAFILVWILDSRSPEDWSLLYLCATLISTAIGIILVTSELGKPKWQWSSLLKEWKEGFYFSISTASVALNSETNKILLVRLSTLEASGIFAAASRVVEVALSPIRALMSAIYARFFKEGEDGISSSLGLAKRFLPFSSLYGILAACCLYFSAPLVPFLLGAEYANAVQAIQWLSVIPIIKSVNSLLQDTLTGSGYQGWRSGIQIIVAICNVVLNLVLIPQYSWIGAAIAAIASDLLLLFGFWGAIYYFYQKQRRLEPVGADVGME